MKTKIRSFRIEHLESKMGIFNHTSCDWSKDIWGFNSDSDKLDEINENFSKIPALYPDFMVHFPDEISDEISELDELRKYKCAFNSVEDLFSILPIHLIEFILTFDFQIVEVVGVGLKSPHQTFFEEEEVRIKPVKLNKLLNKLAKKEAKKHIGKSLKITNYIIQEF